MASGHDRHCSNKAHFDRLGRIATKHARSRHYRFWLRAAVRRIVIYVGLTSSSGNSDVEYPLLGALRTHVDEPLTVAPDPKQTYAPEPFLTAYRP